ncbi:MAG: 4Fe-4S dicluster domain-containing protein [Polyangiales bacterium]
MTPLDTRASHASGPVGFFTDTTVCIGCKACEVACKQWTQLPDDGFVFTGNSYDNSGDLGGATWRHVSFIEQERPARDVTSAPPAPVAFRDGARGWEVGASADIHDFSIDSPPLGDGSGGSFAWLMMSDVCKHCVRAGCLEACPTGSIVRTEFGSVYVQPDVCNGCGYCVVACPFGVIDRRADDGRAWKCTLCYDRLKGDLEPACAKACPTDSIVFGPLEALKVRAAERVAALHGQGKTSAYLYGADAASQPGTEGLHAFFLLTDRPEVYNLPPDPIVPTKRVGSSWAAMALAGVGLAAIALGAALSVRPVRSW